MSTVPILVLAAIGLVLFVGFLKIAVQGPPKDEPSPSAVSAVGEMVSLQGLFFEGSRKLLDSTEYRLLKSAPELVEVAKSFRKERRMLVLLWISLLRQDVHTLWRFRRFLVREGVPATLKEEAGIFGTALLVIAALGLMRIFVFVFGPFAFSDAMHGIQRMVERVSRSSALILERLPQSVWPELERNWQNRPG